MSRCGDERISWSTALSRRVDDRSPVQLFACRLVLRLRFSRTRLVGCFAHLVFADGHGRKAKTITCRMRVRRASGHFARFLCLVVSRLKLPCDPQW